MKKEEEIKENISIILLGEIDDKDMRYVNSWLLRRGLGAFRKNRRWTGGNMFFEGNVYIAAFKEFNSIKFIDFLKSLKWKSQIQILAKTDQERLFSCAVFPKIN